VGEKFTSDKNEDMVDIGVYMTTKYLTALFFNCIVSEFIKFHQMPKCLSKSNVIETDYNSFAIIYTCTDYFIFKKE
jgi:hypothetical protein